MTPLPLFLDTSIQVERVIGDEPPANAAKMAQFLSGSAFKVACVYSRLEFKRVVVQNLALVLRYLNDVDPPSFFHALQKAARLGIDRRKSTLVSILAWTGCKVKEDVVVTLGDDADRLLAIRATAYLRNAIRMLWIWYEKKTDTLVDGLKCARGTEGPAQRPDGVGFDTSIPES